MAMYFFHLHECGTVTVDDEGCELADLAAARAHAQRAARSIMCSELIGGELCLSCHIEIENREIDKTSILQFRDAVRITG